MRKNILAVVFLAICPLAFAQQALNNDAVIKLVKSGQSEDTIVSTINTSPGTYDTSAEGLTTLKAAGASDKVVAAIVGKASAGATPAVAPIPPSPAPAASPGAAPVPPVAEPQKQLSLCEFHVNGSTKAGNAAVALGAVSTVTGVIVSVNGTQSYYPSINKEVQHIYETELKASDLFQYVDREKLDSTEGEKPLPLADTAAKNKLFACVSAKPYWNNRAGFNKQLNISTKWEIAGPGGCKLKFDTSVATKETYGKFPNGADPALKPAYLELSKEDARKFLEELPGKMEKAGCGK